METAETVSPFFFSKFAVPREKRESIVRSRNRENSALAVLHRRSSSRSRYEPVNELPLRGAARSSAIGEGIPAEFVITESKLKAKIRGRVGKDRSVRLISRVRTPFRILMDTRRVRSKAAEIKSAAPERERDPILDLENARLDRVDFQIYLRYDICCLRLISHHLFPSLRKPRCSLIPKLLGNLNILRDFYF